MDPMQGPRDSGGSSTEVNQAETTNMLNSPNNGFQNNSLPSGRASSSSNAAQNNQLLQDEAIPFSEYVPYVFPGSSSNPMPQHRNMIVDIAQTSLGSSSQAAGKRSAGPASSSGGWGSSCKRMALEGTPFSGEATHRVVQTENGVSSSLSLATPSSQTSPNVTNHFGRTEHMSGSGGGRADASGGFHSTRNTNNILPRRSRRLNPSQPQDSVAFSISPAGSSVPPAGSLQQNLPLNSPFVAPLDVRSTSVTSGSTTGENQTTIVHLPALTRNVHQFALDVSFSSRASTSSTNGMPAERLGPQCEIPRVNPEQPMYAPATDMRNPVHDQSVWSFMRGSTGSSIGTSSSIHLPQPSQAWIPPPHAPLHNPSDLFPYFFPDIESQPASASHGVSLPLSATSPSISANEGTMPSGSNSRSQRSTQRRLQDELLHMRHLRRSLAVDSISNRRNQILSEIRQVSPAMRRGENVRFEGMIDRHHEMRIDVDNMSYEELLALEEQIGDVKTGLSEKVILKAMKQHKHASSSSNELHQDTEPCCICREEYVEGDDLGTLECGHKFHKDCIKEWLVLKNLCPICKTKALTTS